MLYSVATVLTVYGIETFSIDKNFHCFFLQLQQYLPFTVLKHIKRCRLSLYPPWLQQYLPFTVLKPHVGERSAAKSMGCNSTYRLRY